VRFFFHPAVLAFERSFRRFGTFASGLWAKAIELFFLLLYNVTIL
jgi:hypothetical protein